MALATQTHKLMPALLAIVCACASLVVRAQTTAKEPRETTTVTGRVVAEGHGVAGVLVALMPAQFTPERKPVAKAKTDADGRFLLTDVPPGSYYLNTAAPVYVNTDENPRAQWQGRLLNVAAGDRLDGIDFTLVRGGVITGRVTNAEGKPVIETQVRLLPVDEAARRNVPNLMNRRPRHLPPLRSARRPLLRLCRRGAGRRRHGRVPK